MEYAQALELALSGSGDEEFDELGLNRGQIVLSVVY